MRLLATLGHGAYTVLAITLALEVLVLMAHMAMGIESFIIPLTLAIGWTAGQIAIAKIIKIISQKVYAHGYS